MSLWPLHTGAGNLPAGNLPAGNLTAGNLPAGNLPAGNLSTGNLPGGNLSTGNLLAGNLPAGNLPAGNLPAGNLFAGNLPAGNLSTGNLPAGNLPVEPQERGWPVLAVDSAFGLRAQRVADTVLVDILWARAEKDKIDVRLDVVDLGSTIRRSYHKKVRVGAKNGGSTAFVVPAAASLELDTATYYYVISAVPDCNCEDLLALVTACHPESYSWPEPQLQQRIARHGRKYYLVLRPVHVVYKLEAKPIPSHPKWNLLPAQLDILPGQEVELEITGLTQGEVPLPTDFSLQHK